MDIKVPDCSDPYWVAEQLRALRSRIEPAAEEKMGSDIGDTLEECIEILDALQEYAGG